jgi:signal transduction histidine kinase
LLDEIVRLLRPEARASGITFRRLRPDMPLPRLPMDAEKMKQVFINLFRNAIEAMPDGGQVTVESREELGQACLTVRDNGPGLPADIDIYQLFVSTKQGGTGLGLSIAQQIVLDHGGTIAAESPEGGGAVFTVRLPLALGTEPAVAV